jgi:protein SCO1/2
LSGCLPGRSPEHRQGRRQLEKTDPALAERIQPIFITVDPERDTPEVMKQYVSAFHPRLIGLTGTPQQIKEVVRKFGAWGEKEDKPGATDYGVNHSRIAILFGPKGEPIAILPHEQGAEAIAAELKRWVI